MSIFTTFTNHMDGAVKNMQKTCADQTAKFQSHFKREYSNVGKAFIQLGAALQQDGMNCEREIFSNCKKSSNEKKNNQQKFFSKLQPNFILQ